MTIDEQVPFLREFYRVLIRAQDDLTATLVGSTLVERFMAELLHSQMPNLTKRYDPLLADGLPLSLAPMAKWAYSLGLIEKHTVEACARLSKLRNNAAHLKNGPAIDLSIPPETDLIDEIYELLGLTEENLNAWKFMTEGLDISPAKTKFNLVVVQLVSDIYEQQINREK